MVRIDFFVFGYRKIYIKREDLARTSSILLRAAINSHTNSDGEICVRERDFTKTTQALSGHVQYEISETLGLYGLYKAIPHKPTIIITSVVSLIMVLVLSSLVWDIRIEGDTNASEQFIETALAESGFYIGKVWRLCDLSKIEAEFLSSNPNFSWININRRGTVAYVVVSDNKNQDNNDVGIRSGYANIVASTDCIIEEIRVVKGKAMVKRGDVVKAGDLLISGVVSLEDTGEFCYAEGEVIGRMSDTVSVFVDRNYEKNLKTRETLINRELKIFDFSINIFKRYRKSNTECDIIDDVKVFSLFGKCLLPIRIISKYERVCEKETVEYTDEELVMLASSRLSLAVIKRVVNADLVKIKTSGSFVTDGYSMSSDIEFIGNVGVALPFDTE